jgi:hypothetical protein
MIPRGRAAAALGAAALWLGGAGCRPARPAPPAPARGHTASLEGVTLNQFAGTTLRRRLRADQLMVLPKRIGILQVAGLRELVVTGARLELFEDVPAEGRSAAEVLFSGGELPTTWAAPPPDRRGRSPRGLQALHERLTGATIYGFECDLVRRGAADVRVQARRVTLEPRSGDLVLEDLVVEESPTRSVRAHRGTWRASSSAIVVSGWYEQRDGDAVERGRGLRIDLERLRADEPSR